MSGLPITQFNKAFDQLLIAEGGYSENPRDPGYRTRYGITEKVARENGYLGSMGILPLEFAKTIYQKKYWREFLDHIPYPVAFNLFDAAVNSGTIQANIWLQKALGVTVDGRIGPETLAALKAANPGKVVADFNAHRLLFLTNLPIWSEFGKGWARRIASNLLVT